MDIVKEVKEREARPRPGIGKAWPFPTSGPTGPGPALRRGLVASCIAYGAPDGRDVHLLVCNYVPDTSGPNI